jgi:hypothetical protein
MLFMTYLNIRNMVGVNSFPFWGLSKHLNMVPQQFTKNGHFLTKKGGPISGYKHALKHFTDSPKFVDLQSMS